MTQSTDGQFNVLKFRQLVDADPALQAEVASCVGDGRWNPSAIVAIGASRGLRFTAQDLIQTMDENDELSDFELELVAAADGIGSCGNTNI